MPLVADPRAVNAEQQHAGLAGARVMKSPGLLTSQSTISCEAPFMPYFWFLNHVGKEHTSVHQT